MIFSILQTTPIPSSISSSANGPVDWLPIIIAGLSFLASLWTYYATIGSKYNGAVYPSSQLILSWIGTKPCVITDCLFINRGARPGYVEDIMLIIKDESGSGTTTIFKASMIVIDKDFDALAEEGERQQRVKNFSPVWLNCKESLKHTIIFQPYNCGFDILTATTIKENLTFRSFDPKSTNSAPWINSGVFPIYSISANNLSDWKNTQERKSVPLESTQLIEKRTEMFKSL